MLGKLMKYEWKNIWRAGTLMLLGMFVVTVIGCVVLRMLLHRSRFRKLFQYWQK